MDDLIVIDDFIPVQLQDKFDMLLHSQGFNWVYSDNTAQNQESFTHYVKNYSGVGDKVLDDGQMVSNIFHSQAPEELMQTKYLDMVTSLIWFMFDKVEGSHINEFRRIKANLGMRKGDEFEGKIATPHVDWKYPNSKSILYYVNDADGDTIIYNERYGDTIANVPLTERKRVKPKKGRAIIFDSDIVHSHQYNLISKTRSVINLCFDAMPPQEDLFSDEELQEIPL
jgi:hypothetical protein